MTSKCERCGTDCQIDNNSTVRISGLPVVVRTLKLGATICISCTEKIVQEWVIRKREIVELAS